MNISGINIPNIPIKDAYNRILYFFKDLIKLPYFWHYCIASIILTLFFIIVTFPYEMLVYSAIKDIEKKSSSHISIAKLKVNILTDSIAENVNIELKGGTHIILSSANFTVPINPFSLLVTKHYEGKLQIIDLKIEGEKIKILTDADIIYDFRLNGPNRSVYPHQGNILLTFKDITIKGITLQGFDIPDLKISQLKSELAIDKGNVINLKYCVFVGSDIKGNAFGTLSVSDYFPNSAINVTIQIDTQSKILDDYKVLLESILKPGTKNLIIKITGTIGNPSITTQ